MKYQETLIDSTNKYGEACTALAESEAVYKDVDSQTKTKLAQAYGRTRGTVIKTKEMESLFDPEYIKWQEVVSTARTQYLSDRANRDIQEKRFACAQSVLSMEKAKLTLL